MKKSTCILAGLLIHLAFAGSASAAQKVWFNIGTDYNTAANWNGGLPGAGDNAYFSSNVTNQPVLSGAIQNQQILFTTTTGGWTLSGASALTLTSNGTGNVDATGSAIVCNNTSGTNTISAPIILGQGAATTATLYQAAGGTLVISGNISSTNAIAGLSLAPASSTAQITLSGSNTYSGNTTLSAGTSLAVGHNNALSTGALNLIGAATLQAVTNDVALANNINGPAAVALGLTISGTKNLTVNGLLNVGISGDLTNSIATGKLLTLGNVNLASNSSTTSRDFNLRGTGDTLVTGTISDGYVSGSGKQSVDIYNTGTTTFSGNNTYTGITYIGVNSPGATLVITNVANGGTASALGMSSNAAGNLYFFNGTLKYTGTAASTDRLFSFLSGNATLDASGSGAINFTNSGVLGSSATRTLNLTGTNTAVSYTHLTLPTNREV